MTYGSSLALRILGAQELVARSAEFQKQTGSADATEAKKHIHAGEITLENALTMAIGGTLEFARPCAVLGIYSHSYQQLDQGAEINVGVNGGVWLLLLANAEQPTDHTASFFTFAEFLGLVMDQVAENFGEDVGASDYTLWPFRGASLLLEPLRPDLADRPADDYWIGSYLLFDSIDGGGGA